MIEVASLAQLDAIRWDLNGDGASAESGYALAFPEAPGGMGCPVSGCAGYELTADLDFDTDGSGTVDAADTFWDGGAGWEPIGRAAAPFAATFEGNGHTLAHLHIDRGTTLYMGLFGQTGASSVVRHVGLMAVDVTGHTYVGGLVGWNEGRIVGSYVSGQVTGAGTYTGGLVGWNHRRISASYATATVAGGSDAGGLVGGAGGHSQISASYATGAVTGSVRVGGLAGYNDGRISASYAIGAVTATVGPSGGLVGSGTRSTTASYWDTETSGQASSGAGTGQTTSALQTPTGYTGLYVAWNLDLDGVTGGDDPWDFGTTSQYPVLAGGRGRERHGDLAGVRGPAPEQCAGVYGRRHGHPHRGREHGGGDPDRRAGGGDGCRRRRHTDLHAQRDGRGQFCARRGQRAIAGERGAGLRAAAPLHDHHHGHRRPRGHGAHHRDDHRGRPGRRAAGAGQPDGDGSDHQRGAELGRGERGHRPVPRRVSRQRDADLGHGRRHPDGHGALRWRC